MTDVCAVVTTFQPDAGFAWRVERILVQVGFVIIVDDGGNGDNVSKLKTWFAHLERVCLVHNAVNVGIAESLNIGIAAAKEKGYHWILTLDDDSIVRTDFVTRMIDGLKNVKPRRPIGIIGMSWADLVYSGPTEQVEAQGRPFSEKRGLITSGCLFSVATYDRIGPYRSEFFMDFVDYDFCLRARTKGLAVVKLTEIGFEHSLGQRKVHLVFGRRIVVDNHAPFRVYYGFRNSIVLAIEYLLRDPLFSAAIALEQARKFLKILFFENEKSRKLNGVLYGLRDGLLRNLGKRAKSHV